MSENEVEHKVYVAAINLETTFGTCSKCYTRIQIINRFSFDIGIIQMIIYSCQFKALFTLYYITC